MWPNPQETVCDQRYMTAKYCPTETKPHLSPNFSWNSSITDIFLGFCWNFELALFKEYPSMSDSNGCFYVYHVWGPSTLPIEEWKKTLKMNICLEMLHSISVTRNSQLKITWSKLRKPLVDIPWHNLTLEVTLSKF